jgi:Holliday junction DNA helicase RuvA
VVIDVHGVGYELWIPLTTYAELPDEGKDVSLHVHTAVREDAIQLFGFASVAERDAFELLLRASRVGPRLAQTILSGISASDLVGAIVAGDHRALRRVPGVGPKMAERIPVELRERAAELASRAGPRDAAGRAAPIAGSATSEAVSALVNLGYPRNRAEQVIDGAVAAAGDEASLESLIREALRRLSQ